jgi:hypothetical protein
MTARTVVTTRNQFDVTGTGYRPEGGIELDEKPVVLADHPDLAALLTTMAVCNDARLQEIDGQWRVVGEPTEGALPCLLQEANQGIDHCDGNDHGEIHPLAEDGFEYPGSDQDVDQDIVEVREEPKNGGRGSLRG